MIDLHVHTWRCRHGVGTAEEYVAAARAAGVRTLAFTEHLPLPAALLASDPSAASYAMPESELAEYVAEVTRLKSLAAERGGPEVLLGIEADLHPGNEEHVVRLLAEHPFDVVLGSVHYVDGWAFDDPDRREGYAAWDAFRLWERYFDDVAAAARSGLIDVVAHLDLVKKFGFVPTEDLGQLYARTAAALAAADVSVELNTAGLRKPCAEIYPAPALLGALMRAGVSFTIGSDAHSPTEVGAGWGQAARLLSSFGVTSVVVYRERRKVEVAL